jgi:hypothetical protein
MAIPTITLALVPQRTRQQLLVDRAARIDALAPDRRESALSAERYLQGRTAQLEAAEQWLRWVQEDDRLTRLECWRRLLGVTR